jgi:membrane-anchored protein YejM (alkaline phosphatase superfamily)
VSPRRRLLRWGSWFAAANVGLLAVVGLRYLWHYSVLGPSFAWLYAIVAFAGQMSLFAYVPFLVVLAPVTLLVPRRSVIVPLGVFLASAVLGFLVLDSLVFAENRYHLGILTASLLAPHTWAFLAFYVLVGTAIEAMLAGWVWQRTTHAPRLRIGRYLALGLVLCIVASHVIHSWAHARYYVAVTAFTRYLPLYFPLRDRGLVGLGLVRRTAEHDHGLAFALGRPPDGELSYPLAPLRCQPPSPLLNVVLIVVDAMRADALTPAVAPRLAAFAPHTIRVDAHYSGGNSSRSGMFSLFYGVPATYWPAFADVARPPVLMDLFRRYDYQLGLFASSPVYRAAVALDRTVLARIPNLRLDTGSPYAGSSGRDRSLTDEWLGWLERRDPARPFFGFLYYNAAVAVEPPDDYHPAIPMPRVPAAQARQYTRYLTAVHYVDSLVGRVLDDLERRQLLERTVIVVTSDHGMEFDENGLGFTGHGTAFSALQMHTPLLIRWPGRGPERIARRTSHNDVAPTLVTGVFGCTNPPADYSSGQSLFSGEQWEWLIAASYADYALIEPERVTIVYPAGYEIRDRNYRLIEHPTLPRDSLRAALREMSRFYR